MLCLLSYAGMEGGTNIHGTKREKIARGLSCNTHPVFKKHALAIGQLVLAYNSLQESLSFLFSAILTGGFSEQQFTIWHELDLIGHSAIVFFAP